MTQPPRTRAPTSNHKWAYQPRPGGRTLGGEHWGFLIRRRVLSCCCVAFDLDAADVEDPVTDPVVVPGIQLIVVVAKAEAPSFRLFLGGEFLHLSAHATGRWCREGWRGAGCTGPAAPTTAEEQAALAEEPELAAAREGPPWLEAVGGGPAPSARLGVLSSSPC